MSQSCAPHPHPLGFQVKGSVRTYPKDRAHSCLTHFPAPSLHTELKTLELLGLAGWGLPVLEATAIPF